ncbi:MAG TPA: hypothetical protein VM364_19090 [Vicinamibacterales bacterium]|nr:hypothetical protein [Vicinamibacterales bacterium]HWI16346.1 hypothetical protein [Vicinamibacterales bacterium]
MDTATVSVLRRPELVTPEGVTKTDAVRKLTVKAIFLLSESGRKASLLAGGDGRELQTINVDVPANRLHLVVVDPDGKARLKLRPRYEVRPDGRVVQIGTPPVYDRPPTIDELFLAAAKNHELERAFVAQGSGRRARTKAALREVKLQLAETFLATPEQRARIHPPPEPKRCWLDGPDGKVLFDADRDQGIVREVPAEAYRRYRAEERVRRQRNSQERKRRLAVRDGKKQVVAEWIATNGTPDQQDRQAKGLLPFHEAREAIADKMFEPLRDWPPYARNGPAIMEAHLRRYPEYKDAVITERDLAVSDENATQASAAQWARAQEARALLPDATVTLRSHRLTWREHPEAPALTLYGLLVVRTFGPIVLRREFAVPQDL